MKKRRSSSRRPTQRTVTQSQAVGRAGPGALVVDSRTVLVAGLDAWWHQPGSRLDLTEFDVVEPRLAASLGVSRLYKPPDFRRPFETHGSAGGGPKNQELKLPVFTFPEWFVCIRRNCGTLKRVGFRVALDYVPRCDAPDPKGARTSGQASCGWPMRQVTFVTMCDRGHLNEFPWRDWAHQQRTTCLGDLSLRRSGASGSLAAQVVRCACGRSASMRAALSQQLKVSAQPYPCQGRRPWLGDASGHTDSCSGQMRASLLSSTNLYYPLTRSAVFLPTVSGTASVDGEMLDFLNGVEGGTMLAVLAATGGSQTMNANQVAQLAVPLAKRFVERTSGPVVTPPPETVVAMSTALAHHLQQQAGRIVPSSGAQLPSSFAEDVFREQEHGLLAAGCESRFLTSRPIAPRDFSSIPELRAFKAISRVPRLRVTTALYGFARVLPVSDLTYDELQGLMYRTLPAPSDRWLPASVRLGEGLLVSLDLERIRHWEEGKAVKSRIHQHASNFDAASQGTPHHVRLGQLNARYVLLHTLSHLLIRRLAAAAGYQEASLTERLYLGTPERPQASLLLFTTGGSDGTLGGLVRMSEPQVLRDVMRGLLLEAAWCSTDPICMEQGETLGSGPFRWNMAACYACALVPETSCEAFNSFLDRGLIIGAIDQPDLGFFAPELADAVEILG